MKRRNYNSGAQKPYKKIKQQFMGNTSLHVESDGENNDECFEVKTHENINLISAESSSTEADLDIDCDSLLSDYSDEDDQPTNTEQISSAFSAVKPAPVTFIADMFLIEVRRWALSSNLNHEQLRGFLSIWNKHVPLENLPSDPRTVLRTPRQIELKNENYWHHGLRRALSVLEKVQNLDLPEEISLRFNMDGLPIFKSTTKEVWPILVDISEIKWLPPCIVGIYCGESEF